MKLGKKNKKKTDSPQPFTFPVLNIFNLKRLVLLFTGGSDNTNKQTRKQTRNSCTKFSSSSKEASGLAIFSLLTTLVLHKVEGHTDQRAPFLTESFHYIFNSFFFFFFFAVSSHHHLHVQPPSWPFNGFPNILHFSMAQM